MSGRVFFQMSPKSHKLPNSQERSRTPKKGYALKTDQKTENYENNTRVAQMPKLIKSDPYFYIFTLKLILFLTKNYF